MCAFIFQVLPCKRLIICPFALSHTHIKLYLFAQPVHFPSTTSSKRRGMWPTIAEDARRYGIVVRATSSKDLLVAELSKLIQKIGLEPGSKRKLCTLVSACVHKLLSIYHACCCDYSTSMPGPTLLSRHLLSYYTDTRTTILYI